MLDLIDSIVDIGYTQMFCFGSNLNMSQAITETQAQSGFLLPNREFIYKHQVQNIYSGEKKGS